MPSGRARQLRTRTRTHEQQTHEPPTQAVEAVRAVARTAHVLERASSELSMAHYRVLSSVAAGEDRASRMAERLELGRPTVSAAVDALCRGGLLLRREVEGDRRAVDLRVTDRGAALLERVEQEMVRRLADLCARTPDGETIVSALASLGAAIDERAAERLEARRGNAP